MSANLLKNLVYEISSKFFLWGFTVFHADGRTDMTNSIIARCNRFLKAPKRGLTLIFVLLIKVSSVLLELDSREATAGFR